MKNKTIAIIPARGGSKRLPNKNIMLLDGIPLVAHSILFAQKHSFIDEIFVTTNDESIKKIAIQYGAKVIDRPENLLNEAFEIFQKENYDSLFTVSGNHQKFGKIVDNKFIPFNYDIGQRSQDLEPLFFENGLLYITKAKLILEDVIISENAFPLEVNHIFANVDIDTQEDFDYATSLLKTIKE